MKKNKKERRSDFLHFSKNSIWTKLLLQFPKEKLMEYFFKCIVFTK